jgi:hypothetical protein
MGRGVKTTAKTMIEILDHARPYDISMIDINVPSNIKRELQLELERKFRLWEESWMRPLINEILSKFEVKR